MTKIIVLTGPESTAKSTLTRELARQFGGSCFPEFARSYLEGKPSHYTYQDVEAIARGQIAQYDQALASAGDFAFLDTWLFVTKVWFDWVYRRRPQWLDQALHDRPVHLYLLCRPDIPWEPDPLRENGGEQREKLFQQYKRELQKLDLPFVEIGGEGPSRIQNAVQAIQNFNF
ncbi:AAA family ATPase [Mangrovibacterium marinum]|uniref:NadR type nicotinamide-nucleotide adenylyltransferase n=1 Tax=Mangrovibacterium marinum TaxID=1639118 RepID=A0A2T5BZT8_9BACT|nr:ATP-binding protein [Mangrovibacterium marinum]PTN07805.1 NadR type nicotinamide-nucleotide adenylyltransferase [Mangrovibacterium marinum]